MKLVQIILHMVRGLWTLKRLAKRNDPRLTRRQVQLWHRKALHLFGFERILVGDLPKGPCLIVSNHLSWIDILLNLEIEALQYYVLTLGELEGVRDLRRWRG